MTTMLIQQQVQKLVSHDDESLFSIKRGVDELFFNEQDPVDFLYILQQYVAETHTSVHDSSSENLADTNSFIVSPSHLFLSIYGNKEDKEVNDYIINENKAIVQEDKISDTVDNIVTSTITNALDKDTSSNSQLQAKLHFHDQRYFTSLMRTHQSNNEAELKKEDSIQQKNINQIDKPEYLNETQEQISVIESHMKKDNSIKTVYSNTKAISSDRFRRRKLGTRSYPEPASTSFKYTLDNQNQSLTPKQIPYSSQLSTRTLSAASPVTTVSILTHSQQKPTGVLRRTCRVGQIKKTVHFADSVGYELEQIQYIQSLPDNDLTDFTFSNNKLHSPKLYNTEHKPWTLNVESTQSTRVRKPKTFFCLYQQPYSAHPDAYLHDVWTYKIKLEYANMHLKSSLTGEQCLHGTIWLTNIDYDKNVTVQYTFDRWLNKYEYEAKHCWHANDFRNIDQFEFTIDISHDIDRIDFALRYRTNGQEYWDNNGGQNYTLETESAYTPRTTISLPQDCTFNEIRFY